MPSRREFLQEAALAGIGLSLGGWSYGQTRPPHRRQPSTFLDLHRFPDAITIRTADGLQRLSASGNDWRGNGVSVTMDSAARVLRVRLSAAGAAVTRLHLRWRGSMGGVRLALGDAWERGYGDLEWRGLVPDRAMPWYFAAYDGNVTHAYGVRTSPKAFCFWQLDSDGISLFADVRSGGAPLQLGDRALDVCDIVCRKGQPGESAFAALHAFCREMSLRPRPRLQPPYGSNDWYWAYGRNSAASVLADAKRIVDLSPPDGNRPFAVIDDGWQPQRDDRTLAGRWDRGNTHFDDMAAVAAGIRRAGARPGIWIRPLQAPADIPDGLRLPRDRAFLDPSLPETAAKVSDDIARLRTWGFDLIKHDYTTYDLFGRWGFGMGTTLTKDGWMFASGAGRTTAEVIDELYRTIRAAAGDAVVIGCNTVGHLSAGIFDVCRIGDDTSGTDWARTRKMGVNTLAFRGVQHGAFYTADADCVGVTNAIPWRENRQWLDLVARSGTALFVSLAPDAVTAERARDLRAALSTASRPRPLGEPLDWQQTIWPSKWRLLGDVKDYDWVGADGASPAGAS
jgi:alpha-galactosidase